MNVRRTIVDIFHMWYRSIARGKENEYQAKAMTEYVHAIARAKGGVIDGNAQERERYYRAEWQAKG